MAEAKRATVYFETDVHRALRLKSAETDRSVSDLVNEAVRAQLAEDADDLEAFRYGASEAGLSGYLEGLDHKYRHQELCVLCVKPGFVKTDMTARLRPPPLRFHAWAGRHSGHRRDR
jgi:NAD(P)-dependent dehydrogenase (short-subunit alcohol dehydrogenase family)